jgi:hypothetical protein
MGLEGLLSDFQHYLERYSIIAVAHDADVLHLEGVPTSSACRGWMPAWTCFYC